MSRVTARAQRVGAGILFRVAETLVCQWGLAPEAGQWGESPPGMEGHALLGAGTPALLGPEVPATGRPEVCSTYLPASLTFRYDFNGNLTNDGVRTFEYDFENQLTNVFVANGWRSEPNVSLVLK